MAQVLTVGAADTALNMSDTLKLVACHIALTMVPASGIDEIAECIDRVIEFHRDRSPAHAIEAPVRSFPAQFGRTYERPPLVFSED